MNTYGDHIRKKRLELNLYQSEVAKLIGVSTPEVIKDWELNHSNPKIKYIPKIISFLGYAPEIIKNPIKRYRIERGITQEQFARMLEIDPTTLARIEASKGNRIKKDIKRKLTQIINFENIKKTKKASHCPPSNFNFPP